MSDARHLTDDQLIRAIDGETIAAEQASVETHLAQCEMCLERYEALVEFSSDVEQVVGATPVHVDHGARERLRSALEQPTATIAVRSRRVALAWTWAAIAASALVLLFFSGKRQPTPPESARAVLPQQASPVLPSVSSPAQPVTPAPVSTSSTVRKELRPRTVQPRSAQSAERPAFIQLPYVGNAQAVQTAGIVRVEMKLSMLANAGVIRMMPGAADAPVEADLLLGLDGQPYAIRFVSH
jgi:anti-sigma factor RsiW